MCVGCGRRKSKKMKVKSRTVSINGVSLRRIHNLMSAFPPGVSWDPVPEIGNRGLYNDKPQYTLRGTYKGMPVGYKTGTPAGCYPTLFIGDRKYTKVPLKDVHKFF